MSKGRHNFRLNDTTRLIKATQAAGEHVSRIEHDPRTGRISVFTGKADDVAKLGTGAELPDQPRREP